MEHIITVHSRPFSLLPETAFGRGFLIEQANRNAPHEGKVFRTMSVTDAGRILAKGDIQDERAVDFQCPNGRVSLGLFAPHRRAEN